MRLLRGVGVVVMAVISVGAGAQVNPVGIDFSFAGYGAGEALPQVKAVLRVRASGVAGGDDTRLLQAALDKVGAMPWKDGFRGAVVLEGRFQVAGSLRMTASGVVLRGGTIVATGVDRRSLIVVGGTRDAELGPAVAVTEDAAAGSRVLAVESLKGFGVGDHVVVKRPSTAEWISAMSMSGLPGTFANQRLDWHPGSHDLTWDRVVTGLDFAKKAIELDAPITTALEKEWGGGTVAKALGGPSWRIGIEGVVLESAYDASRPKDEDHSWIAIQMDHVEDAWVRNVTARHFVSSAVRVNWRGRRITVEGVRSEAPVSEEGGYRRQAFLVNGQQVLVHRAYSEAGMNDFASGLIAGGPNVFLDCEAKGSLGASGAFEGWASGVLYEKVHVPNARLQMVLDFGRAQGGGWTAANSLIWNSTAKSVDAIGPPGARNFVVESKAPLYEAELRARTGHGLVVGVMKVKAVVGLPLFTVSKFQPPAMMVATAVPRRDFAVVGGRFVIGGKAMWGPSQTEAWWRGDTSPLTAAATTGSSVSRFMPGVTAPGLTEDLEEMVARLKARGVVSIQVNPGLWYEHRRDSHSVERRDDGNVWAPFYEMPWARSGRGVAWDGLSKFDLTRYNPWYFARQKEFAEAAKRGGLVVFYDLYNTHDVLEIGPHWIDYPWRPANNVNDTGLPEPPPLKVHNRNDVGNEFFSASYGPLRELHRAYILHTLDELGDQPNVIFGMAYQYAGPLEFEQFFQDVIGEWEAKHHKKVRVALTTGKDLTDAILADPVRSKQIAVVDMRYWEYLPDGRLWAPKAGENHAFREMISKEFPGYTDTPPASTPEMVYKQVREYRDRYPEIALMPMESGAGAIPLLMAGAASQSALVGGRPPTVAPTALQQASGMYPQRAVAAGGAPGVGQRGEGVASDKVVDGFVAKYLAGALMRMSPKDGWVEGQNWVLAGGEKEPVVVYSFGGGVVVFGSGMPRRKYEGVWVDPRTGEERVVGVVDGEVKKPDEREWLLVLR